MLEYFISTHGARKGLADTALKTADAGYLTRRLVDVAQDVIINEDDCGTIRGLEIGAAQGRRGDHRAAGATASSGRVAAEDVVHPITDEVIVEAGELIDEDVAERIEEAAKAGIDKMRIRSVLTCEARRGVCAQVLRPQPGHRPPGRHRRGGRRHRRAVDRRAGHPAHAAHLPHRRHGEPHRRADARSTAKDDGHGPLPKLDIVELGATRRRPATLGRRVGHKRRDRARRRGRTRRASASTCPTARTCSSSDGADGRGRAGRCSSGTPTTCRSSPSETGTVRFVDIKEKVTVRDEVDENTGPQARWSSWRTATRSCSRPSTSSTRPASSSPTTRCRPARACRCSDGAGGGGRRRRWSRSAASLARPATSPAVCRASPSCSRRAGRRTRPSSPRSTASSSSAASPAACARCVVARRGRRGRRST